MGRGQRAIGPRGEDEAEREQARGAGRQGNKTPIQINTIKSIDITG